MSEDERRQLEEPLLGAVQGPSRPRSTSMSPSPPPPPPAPPARAPPSPLTRLRAIARRWLRCLRLAIRRPAERLVRLLPRPNRGRRRWRTWVSIAACACAAVLALALLAASISRWQTTVPSRVVDLGYASYRGIVVGADEGVAQFLGMRYARPPLGEYRFRAPADPEPDEAPEAAVTPAVDAPPLCLGIERGPLLAHESEDCLFVNVWAPAAATNRSSLPVLVFIQGGGYTTNANADWRGTGLVEGSAGSLIVVTFNYRVGLYGFLAGERVRRDGDLNAGLLDQRHLLGWVQRHISAFGGDPAHVVIDGMSAGGGSVAMQLAAYGGRDDGLFVGAVADSLFFPAQPAASELEYQLDRVLADTGCDGDDDVMGCLRSLNVAALQAANRAQPFPGRERDPLFYWTACVDGDLVRDYPYNMFRDGGFVRVPMIAGTVTDEGSVFARDVVSPDDLADFLLDNYPTLTRSAVRAVLAHYPLMPPLPGHRAWFPSSSLAYGDATFVCPNNMVLDSHVAVARRSSLSPSPSLSSLRTWGYRYNVADDMFTSLGLGVPHAAQGSAVFGPAHVPSPASYFSYNSAVVPIVMQYYISFVRTLDPNALRHDRAPAWREWGAARNRLLIELADTRMEVVGTAEAGRCTAWAAIAEKARQ